MAASAPAKPAGEQYALRAGLFTSTFGAMGAYNTFRPVHPRAHNVILAGAGAGNAEVL
jgi:hypothetical protein